MTDYESDDLLMRLTRRRLVGASEKTSQAPPLNWGTGSYRLIAFSKVPPEQDLLSPLPATTKAQENPESGWLLPMQSLTIGGQIRALNISGAEQVKEGLIREQHLNVTISAMRGEINTISQQLTELKQEILRLQSLRSYVVSLTTLSAGFSLKQPIPVTIEGDDENFTATFVEANISASGETESDAIANFKDALVSSYQVLADLPGNQFGPLPARQWEVLRNVVNPTQE